MIKFVVLSHQRAGSNLVRRLLNNHSYIFCFNELMLHDLNNFDLAKEVFRLKEDIKAVGFLLKYNQMTKELEKYILDKNVKVIHLTRNPLHTHISNKLGRGDHHIKPPIKLDLKEAKSQVKIILGLEKKYRMMFDCLELKYEDLIVHEDEHICPLPVEISQQITDFLDINHFIMVAKNMKVNPEEIYKKIKYLA